MLGLLVAACGRGADSAGRYTGIWKTDCQDYWAIQIRPAAANQYSVTFCGLSGCLPPASWLPDTTIDGDPRYDVVSPKRIRIQRPDGGHFTYIRCSADPFWQVGPMSAPATADPRVAP